MRFARQSTIFRGPLDAGPVVGVLFLLVIFILLGSVLYTPGVLVRFADSALGATNVITVTGDSQILFEGKTNEVAGLAQLRADMKNAPRNGPFYLKVEPGAKPDVVAQVRDLPQVELPGGDNLTGTDNPTIVVAVNFRGQCFFENRPVEDAELKVELRRALLSAAHASKKLTMVLWADKATENEVIMRLYRLARAVGITEFLLAERPSVFAAPAAPSGS